MDELNRNKKFSYKRGYHHNARGSFSSYNQYYKNNKYRRGQGFVRNRYISELKPCYPGDELRHKVKINKKNPSRPNSPDEGSEEYMNKKIQKTSAIIMRHLLSPEENIITLKSNAESQNKVKQKPEIISDIQNKRKRTGSSNESSVSDSQNKKKCSTYNVEEIHNKIMTHLTNLNDGRKKNLISNKTSVYDDAINQIVKQKRLEISRALRRVCLNSSDVTESTEWINSIIPDIGIKIEDLPQEVLEELQNTFNTENFEDTVTNNSAEIVPNACNQDVVIIRSIPIEKPSENIPEQQNSTSNSPVEVVEIFKSDIQMDMTPWNSPVEEDNLKSEFQKDISAWPTPIYSVVNLDTADIELHPSNQNSGLIDSRLSFVNTSNCDSKTNDLHGEIILKNDENEIVEFKEISEQSKSPNNFSFSTPCTCGENITMEDFLQRNFKQAPKCYSEAIEQMLTLDKYIAIMTEYRQKLFIDISKNEKDNSQLPDITVDVKTNIVEKEENTIHIDTESEEVQNYSETYKDDQKFLEFNNISEKILVLKVCEDRLLAATESGKIYFYSLKSGNCESVLEVTSVPISSLSFKKEETDNKPYLFVGSRESSFKVYNLYSTSLVQSFPLDDSVQCMDENWGYLFLGCLRGTIVRYSIKKKLLEYQEQFSSNPILVLKATQEGARRVLLIGSRNYPVIVRDAMSGLHLRKLEIMYPTVYSMIVHKSYVICGTTLYDILVFNFHNGNLEHTFKATNAKGVACMKVVGKCLFASCHNGKIYVFNLETKSLVDTMCGPGGVIISMEVISNQVIVGTISLNFASIPICHSILSEMY